MEKQRVRSLNGALLFYTNVLQFSSDPMLRCLAFIGKVETEALIATRDNPFTMKPVWPKIGETNDNSA